jgi:hypothetical protein
LELASSLPSLSEESSIVCRCGGILQKAPGGTNDLSKAGVRYESPKVECSFFGTARARDRPTLPILWLPFHHAVDAMFAHSAVALGRDIRIEADFVVGVCEVLDAFFPLATVVEKDLGQPILVELCGIVNNKHGWNPEVSFVI